VGEICNVGIQQSFKENKSRLKLNLCIKAVETVQNTIFDASVLCCVNTQEFLPGTDADPRREVCRHHHQIQSLAHFDSS
jgi:hypothetical protein